MYDLKVGPWITEKEKVSNSYSQRPSKKLYRIVKANLPCVSGLEKSTKGKQ